jgi:hypothetical protein
MDKTVAVEIESGFENCKVRWWKEGWQRRLVDCYTKAIGYFCSIQRNLITRDQRSIALGLGGNQ